MKTLDEMGVRYRVIVEEQQHDAYAAALGEEKLLVLPQRYFDEYDTCDELGDSKSKGPGAARNFAWDTAIDEGASWHWVMDDNIRNFYRLNRNLKIKVNTGAIFEAMQDFSARYVNVAMAGPTYMFFAKRKQKIPPFMANRRIYSCNLIRNDAPFRWRGRYNEDTILSIDMMKAGWCTLHFNAFLQGKMMTQVLSGGNTEEFYAHEGTKAKSEMMVAVHPDISRMTFRFGRIHHHVDYSVFKRNKLIKRDDFVEPTGNNEYGMRLAKVD